MSSLSPDQIITLESNAGLPESQWATGLAVAEAESGGDPNALNRQSGAAGLWQILPSAHPDLNAAELNIPGYNAAAMVKISGGGSNWQPWETYTNGMAAEAMPEATADVNMFIAGSQAGAGAQPQPGTTNNGNSGQGGSGNFLGIGPGGWTDPSHWPIVGGSSSSQPFPVPLPWAPIPGGPNISGGTLPSTLPTSPSSMGDWWASQTGGERRAIVIGAAIVVLVLVVALRR